jgi:hypothetical protein
MKTLATTGQAAGAGAALCVRYGLTPRGLARTRIGELQQVLLKHDATILNLKNEDEGDLARRATVTASSETPEGSAANVINGINRQFSAEPTNMWISAEGMPQHVELQFEEPQFVNTIYLTFDTDFSFQTDAKTRPPCFEATVRDYRLRIWQGGEWRRVAAVSGNYQRRRQHSFPSESASRIRLDVEAMNGDGKRARVFEIRAYHEPEAP